jgi:hypothetical protein
MTAILKDFEEDEKNGVWQWFSVTSELLEKTRKAVLDLPSTVFLRSVSLRSGWQSDWMFRFCQERDPPLCKCLSGQPARWHHPFWWIRTAVDCCSADRSLKTTPGAAITG